MQAEYDNARFHEAGDARQHGEGLLGHGAFTLTGEARPYKPGDATYGGITPSHAYGAWEIAVRYEKARNEGNNGVFTGFALAGVKTYARHVGPGLVAQRGSELLPESHVRFMLDYEHGKADLGRAGTDSPNTVAARAQLVF